MAKVCARCGVQSSDTAALCANCGTQFPASQPGAGSPQGYPPQPPPPGYAPPPQQQGYSQQGYAPVQGGYPPPPPSGYQAQGYAPPPPAAKSGSAMKWVLGILGVLAMFVVLGVAGLWYAAHKVKQKIMAEAGPVASALKQAQAAADAPTQAATGTQEAAAGAALTGDRCRFLTAAEVSEATGATVTDAVQSDDGCNFYVEGTMVEMLVKHKAAVTKIEGDEARARAAQGVLANAPMQASDGSRDQLEAAGKTVMLTYAISEGMSQFKVDLQRTAMEGKFATKDLPGVGDYAFEGGDGFIEVLKGNRLLMIAYTGCPCSTDEIVPLAKKLADQM